tara:strand:- start:683 stop:3970 length:3288 start_codon:yes stop_codon:yes gene_type:complete
MKSKIILFIIFFTSISLVFNQQKLKFSADSAESYIKNSTKVKIFKDNVVIIDQQKTLYADLATYLEDSSKVILSGLVKMYDQSDSLFCDELIMTKGDDESYEASGNVIFFKGNQIIKSQNLIYFIDSEKIEAYNDIFIKNSSREIYGDSLIITYYNGLINNLNMIQNIKIIDQQTYLLKDNSKLQTLEDKMEAKNLSIEFDRNENINLVKLYGMAQADFNVVNDSLLKGLNSVSGDSITIKIQNNLIESMDVQGGVIGNFKPDKKNKKLNYPVSYSADFVNYDLDNEITILTNSAKVTYGETILQGGQIKADLKDNIVESTIKDSIIPSVKNSDENPTYGDYMKFNLITERGIIDNGYNTIDMGIFKGDNFITDSNENVYITNGMFTSCDQSIPHYHFGSKHMKVDNESSQIITKPMTLYMQDFPIITLPFAILPNSNKKRKSGLIMPSFGHSQTAGTWIQDLGYYFAPNNYYDILTYLDFYDRSKIQLDSKLRYKKLYGNNWYNYNFSGYIQLKNYINELAIDTNDFIDLFDNEKSITKYSTVFEHNQNFSNNQYLRIKYEYYNFENISEVIENDPQIRLDQKEISQLYYSKNWNYSSLTIGASSFKDLLLPEPNDMSDVRDYKQVEYPGINYQFNKPLLFGKGDKWYNNAKLTYNFSLLNKDLTYSKEAIYKCIDNFGNPIGSINSSGDCLENNNSWTENELCMDPLSSEIDTFNTEEQCLEFNNSWNLVWIDSGISSEIKPSSDNKLSLNLPLSVFYFNINPSLSISEQWALSSGIDKINARKQQVTLGINVQSNLYGLIPLQFLNKKIKAIRHIFTPSIYTSYMSKSKLIKGEIDDFNQTRFIINSNSLNNSFLISSINLSNRFQAKIIDKEDNILKREIMSYNISTSYDWNEKSFNPLISTLSFKDISGGEYLRINIEQSLYQEGSDGEDSMKLLNGFPRLTAINTSLSRNFGYKLKGENFNESEGDSTFSNYTQDSNLDLWDASFGFTLTAKYDLVKKWDLEYSTLSFNSNIKLSKSWLMSNKMYVDLVNMKINSYEVEFMRSLHCWEFSFFMKTIGYNKGFGLKISISDPNLQSIKVTQSSMIRGNNW